MMKKRTTISLTEMSDRWVTQQAQEQGISKNSVIQMLINKAIDQANQEKGA